VDVSLGQESPVSRLPVQWRAYLPKRAQIQAVVRPCGALLIFVWFDDSRARKRGTGARESFKIIRGSQGGIWWR